MEVFDYPPWSERKGKWNYIHEGSKANTKEEVERMMIERFGNSDIWIFTDGSASGGVGDGG